MEHGTNRRTALTCMLWAGSGLLWTVAGGVPRASLLGDAQAAPPATSGDLSFIQISDSHIGFHAAPNPDAATTLGEAVGQVRERRGGAELLIHTGDVSHLSRPGEFDTAEQLIRGAGLQAHYVPGEHDVLVNGGKPFFERFGAGAPAGGWYSFDQRGVHFIGLNNVLDLQAGGLGRLGTAQLEWLEDDLRGRASSQPIVVFAHVPLWTVYEQWGWGTEDAAQALAYLRRFGSVTVLNGHIHQVMQKVEGNLAFHTAMSTAFPQPAPGTASSPGPIRDVPAGRLRSLLGITTVREVQGGQPLAIIDTPLGA
ncbi:metallophosphoesterase family protein [Paracraurococcus lichenis]|uniref:Metallophosphoesterase n=1 Tax=Paracraurococcus lichenis TaxID=3064888 RepID=A0ABT9ECI3_9PROT|nr:metallophosphoesterase [Paracraurococcus sp. LOR1-02]MDO9713920.1 metallophosphoesterase [Paracraurococcus sp. LOR1-02]